MEHFEGDDQAFHAEEMPIMANVLLCAALIITAVGLGSLLAMLLWQLT